MRFTQFFTGVLLMSCCWTLAEGQTVDKPATLGKYPVCEPSAVVQVPCPQEKGQCLLVGDNENDTAVFLYPLSAKGVKSKAQTALNIGGLEIGDIEAIAKLAEDRVLI